MRTHWSRTRAATLAIAVTTLALLTGCGASSTDTTATSTPSETASAPALPAGADQAIYDLVPAKYREAGAIDIASDIEYPPFEYYADDNTTVIGIDKELADEMGKLMGLQMNFVMTAFDAIIPGLAAGKFQVASSAMTDNEERRKTVDFLDYIMSGPGIMVAGGNPKGIKTLDDLCGLSVGVAKGTTEVAHAQEQAKKCKADGKKELTVNIYPGQNQMVLALENGRDSAALLDTTSGSYTASESKGKFEMTGPSYDANPGYFGIVFAKGNGDLIAAFQAAMQKLMDNGKYLEILTKYGQQAGAITKTTINTGLGLSS